MTNHAIVVVGETTHAAELFAAGLTDAEIAEELGMTLAAVQALPELQGARLTPNHAARIERAMGAAALPSVGFKDVTDKEGRVTRLEYTIAPDPAAAKVVLPAIDRERYDKAAAPPVAQPAINISVAFITPDHRHTGATIDASPIPAALGNGDPGGGALLASGGGVEAGTGTSPVSDFSKT